MWTWKFTEVECRLLCLQALSVHFEVYRSGMWTVVLTCIKFGNSSLQKWRVDCCVNRH